MRKRIAEAWNPDEREVTRRVRRGRRRKWIILGKRRHLRFDCPACGSTTACASCLGEAS